MSEFIYSADVRWREGDEPLFSLYRRAAAPARQPREVVLKDITAEGAENIIVALAGVLATCAVDSYATDGYGNKRGDT